MDNWELSPMAGLLISDGKGDFAPVLTGLLNDIPKVGNDIRRTLLRGVLKPRQKFNGNFVECRIEEAEFNEVDFSRCDWKDCRIIRTVFEDCELGHSSMMTNFFEGCHFIRCRFPDTAVSDSKFSNCEFTACDLTSIIVKASRFEEAIFDRCVTSNRVIESSLLIGTKWRGMNIEAQLILGNFGLTQNDLEHCELVTRRHDKKLAPHAWSELADIVARSAPSPIERLRFSFFETGDLEYDTEILSAALDLRNWGNDAVVEASLAAQLSCFAQFLITLFSRNCIAVYPILILHSRNFEILSWLEKRSEAAALYQVSAGVHWILSREVESYLQIVEEFSEHINASEALHIAAVGPIDPAYFKRFCDDVELTGVTILSVRPRNSPVDLALAFKDHSSVVAFIALFLACRTKIELSKLPSMAGTNGNLALSDQLLSVSAGFLAERASEYELSVRTLLPKSLLLDLRLSVNLTIFLRAKHVLVGIIGAGETNAAVTTAPPQPKSSPKSRRSPPK